MRFLEEARAAIAPARLVHGTDRWGEILAEVNAWAYGTPTIPPDSTDLPVGVDLDRAVGVEIDGPAGNETVGAAAAWGFDVPVPGGRLDVGGLTWVAVRPGFRGRGFLRAMIAAHFEDCLARGEAASMLFAAQMPIYPRFGYGLASRAVGAQIPAGAPLRQIEGSGEVQVEFATANFAAHDPAVQQVRAEAGRGERARPGWTEETTLGRRERRFANVDGALRRWEPHRIALARRSGEPVGYAIFRRDGHWDENRPAVKMEVSEFVALDSAAARALWGELAAMRLVETIELRSLALDDWLFSLFTDWRLARPVLTDALWLRILDLPGALAARHYAAPVDLVIDIRDPLIDANAGRWRLNGARDGAEVVRAGEVRADIVGGIEALSAAYLGGSGLATWADAGLISENTPGALETLDAALHSYRAPGVAVSF
jgi:predicted acetyltransferase